MSECPKLSGKLPSSPAPALGVRLGHRPRRLAERALSAVILSCVFFGAGFSAIAQQEPLPGENSLPADTEEAPGPPSLRTSVPASGPMDIGIDLGNNGNDDGDEAGADANTVGAPGAAPDITAPDPIETLDPTLIDSAATPDATDTGLGSASTLAQPGEVLDALDPVDPSASPSGLDPLDTSEDEAFAEDMAETLANGPSLLGFPESREELRPSGEIAVLRGLDKITARVTVVEARIGEPIQFGKLEITTTYCYKRPPEEPPEVTAFVQIKDLRAEEEAARAALEISALDASPEETIPPDSAATDVGLVPLSQDPFTELAPEDQAAVDYIFSGWMFASSPALSAVEHPVYDVWLIDCKTTSPESSFGGLSKEPAPKELDAKSLR